MLTPLSVDASRRLRGWFEETGYTEVNLQGYLGAAELPSRRLRNQPRLLDRTREVTLLNSLLRWFWLGRSQREEAVAGVLPPALLQLLLDSGLLEQQGGQLSPRAMLLPADSFLVASDHPSSIDRGDSDLVLWPNPTSKFLARFAVRRHSCATLDLGTGSGILSLGASRYSDHVVATDLNPRVASFVNFNARLNGVENIELLMGDGFQPVAGRSFDLILSNPPFFITPKSDYMFCDNSMELDQLCRKLLREAPAYLKEGGYLQMLCEWAQVTGQPWEERVAEWLDGSGCDAWVMKGVTEYPEEYAQHRIRETTADMGRDLELYQGYMDYYRSRGVEAIHDGLIVIRRRSGKNWVRIEEVPKTPKGDLGELILSTFAAHDLLLEMDTDEKLLATRPRLVAHARLEQVCDQQNGRWHAESLTLRLTRGFPFHWTIQPLVAEFLANCDGTRTAEQVIQAFAASANAPLETVRQESLAMIRKLIERGFVVVAPN
ncbi:MAG TPA: methyltransferase [Acidobacteriaceae bacterium]|nr:methyltransferase [Acidobacteriaceae bacterium]